MKMLLSFTHPEVVTNLYLSFFCRTQKGYFITKQLLVPIDFPTIEKKKKTMEINWVQQLFGYQHSSKYIILCSTKDVQV